MKYVGTVYRPPSEARSLIIQMTVGCAHNSCTFCSMYKDKKFYVRDTDEVIDEFREAYEYYGDTVKRIFLADGDALGVDTKELLKVLDYIKTHFKHAERVTVYGTPHDVLEKSEEELTSLREAGIEMVYMGAESGDDIVLKNINKGVTSDEIIRAGLKLKKCGIKVSITLISGLGSSARLKEHAINTAKLISAIKPEYVGFLTLMLDDAAPITKQIKRGDFKLLTPDEIVEEMRLLLTNVDAEGTVFRSNHASNYMSLKGTLNRNKDRMLKQLEKVKENSMYKHESLRML